MFQVHDTDTNKTSQIYDEEELATAITDTIQYYKDKCEHLREENQQLIQNAQEVVKKNYEQTITNLRERLNLSYGEFASQKEKDAYNQFTIEHMHDRLSSRYNGGRAPYLIPTGGGIGTILKVVCPICGESKDITDNSVW